MSSDNTSLYKAALLDHFKHPRSKRNGEFSEGYLIGRGKNPRCGDDIEVGIQLNDESITLIEFRGRGCSVCLASASMMTEAVTGQKILSAKTLINDMNRWLADDNITEEDIPNILQPLAAVRSHPARKKCCMLAFNALEQAIDKNNESPTIV